jgi:hypothetical protein
MRPILLLLCALALQAQPSYNGLRILPNQAHNATGYVRHFEQNGAHYVGIRAPGSIASSFDFYLPSAPSAGCVQSDVSGNLSISACQLTGSTCITVSAGVITNTCPFTPYTGTNGVSVAGSVISGVYTGAGTVTVSGSVITGNTYTGAGAISVNSGTRVISGTYSGSGCVSVNNTTGVISCTVPATLTAGTCININGSNQIVNTCASSETSGNFGSMNITTTGTGSSLGGLTITGGLLVSSAITASGGLLSQSNGIGALGFNPWNGSSYTPGLTSHTFNVQASPGGGACTIVVLGGIVTGGTC